MNTHIIKKHTFTIKKHTLAKTLGLIFSVAYGFYIVADGGPCAWRAATRPCSFINFQTFAKMIEGHQLADLVAILGSLNIIAAELDR